MINAFALLPLFLLLIASPVMGRDNIVQTAAEAGNFRTLVNLLVATGLDEALEADEHFTVFAPTDEAFAKLPKETLESLLEDDNRETLVAILKYHVVAQALKVPKHPPSHPITEAETLNGAKIEFERDGSRVQVNGADVVARNIRCSNGYIHAIDAVLLPPSNRAGNSLVDVAAQAGGFETLISALKAAGLDDALRGEDQLTVFAPTDAAFAQLPRKTLKSLLQPENRLQLQTILKYHVVPGRITAAEFVQAQTASTLAGPSVAASIKNGQLRVNESNIEANDIEADNGIIHVINQVLLPPDSNASTDSGGGAERIVEIRANWADRIVRDGIITDVLNIKSTGGGSVRLTNVRANRINTTVNGGSSVSLEGEAAEHECRVSGGATLSAGELQTSSTKISVSGGGRARIAANDLLDISAAAGARVRYITEDAKVINNANQYASVERAGSDH